MRPLIIAVMGLGLASVGLGQVNQQAAERAMPADEATQPADQANQPADQAIQPADAALVLFDQKDADLTPAAKESINTLVHNAEGQGVISRVHVAVWSDKPFPHEAKASLSKADQALAEHRGAALKKYLKDSFKITDVKIINMAKGTNWVAKAFKTEDASVKTLFSSDEDPRHTKLPRELLLFKEHGKPSAAVLVVATKQRRTT